MKYLPEILSREKSDVLFDLIQRHFDLRGYGPLAAQIRETGAFAGFVGLSVPTFEAHFTPCVEVGWRLIPEFWNRGLATEGARAALDYAFTTLDLTEIVSFTTTTNAPSRRVMEKLGMTRNPHEDFDHPRLYGHSLRPHVLYRLRRENFKTAE